MANGILGVRLVRIRGTLEFHAENYHWGVAVRENQTSSTMTFVALLLYIQ
jgi:hypothetical protein